MEIQFANIANWGILKRTTFLISTRKNRGREGVLQKEVKDKNGFLLLAWLFELTEYYGSAG